MTDFEKTNHNVIFSILGNTDLKNLMVDLKANIKPTSTTTPYPLGYKYNCEIIYNRVKLPTKAFTKNGSGIFQIMEFKNVDYWHMKGMDDLHILNTILPSNPEKYSNSSMKLSL